MKSNFFLQLIILTLGVMISSSVAATTIQPTEASNWVEEKGKLLLDTFGEQDLEKRYASLDKMFLNYVDLDYVAKFVLGKYWRQLSSEQQHSYRQLFKRYALSVYKSFPLEFDSRQIKYKIISVQAHGKYVDVATNITFKLNPTEPEEHKILLSFRLHKQQNKLQIIDLKIAESSLILSYRGRFYEMIAQTDGDLEWFLEDLEMITQSTEKQNQEKVASSDCCDI